MSNNPALIALRAGEPVTRAAYGVAETYPFNPFVQVHRLTFSAFPILGISLTSETRSKMEIWEKARYEIYPRFLRTIGIARINLVGGSETTQLVPITHGLTAGDTVATMGGYGLPDGCPVTVVPSR